MKGLDNQSIKDYYWPLSFFDDYNSPLLVHVAKMCFYIRRDLLDTLPPRHAIKREAPTRMKNVPSRSFLSITSLSGIVVAETIKPPIPKRREFRDQ